VVPCPLSPEPEAEGPPRIDPRKGDSTPALPVAKGPHTSRRLLLAGAAAVLLVGLLGVAVVFLLRTRNGTLEVTVSEPGVQILIDGQEKVILESQKTGRIELVRW
jgi:hypothetical protein